MLTVDHYEIIRRKVRDGIVLVQREMDKSTLHLRDISCLWQEGFLKASQSSEWI